MRVTAFLLALVLIVSMPLSVAAEPRILSINPSLGFNGTTAICEVMVVGNNMSEYIEVWMKLMHGPYCVGSWYASSYGYVDMEETAGPLIVGDTYKLVVTVNFNGVAKTPVSVSGVC